MSALPLFAEVPSRFRSAGPGATTAFRGSYQFPFDLRQKTPSGIALLAILSKT